MNLESTDARLGHIERMLAAQQDVIHLLLFTIAKHHGPISSELINTLAYISQSGIVKVTDEFDYLAHQAISALADRDDREFRSVATPEAEPPSRLDRDTLRALLRVVPANEPQPQRDTALPDETTAPCEPDRC